MCLHSNFQRLVFSAYQEIGGTELHAHTHTTTTTTTTTTTIKQQQQLPYASGAPPTKA